MKPFLEKYWWAGEVALFLLALRFPDLFPLFIFLGIVLFTQSPKGKDLFDLSKWDNEEITIQKPKKSVPKKADMPKKNSSHSFSLSPMKNMPKNMSFEPKGFSASLVFIAILLFLGVSIVMDGIVSVPAGSTGVVFDKLSNEVKEETLPSGISLKIPFFQQVTVINTRMQEYTINSKREPIEALTKDGQKVNVDVTVQYFIRQENASKLFEEQGMDYESKIIKAGVRSIVREVATGYDSIKLYDQEFRKKAQDEMKVKLEENFKEKHIVLEDVLIRDVKFSGKYLESIELEQVAKVKIKTAENEKKEAEVRKEITIVNAEAEAESIKLKGEALSKSPEIIQLQFVEKMAPSINWGILPDGAVPLIDPKSLQQN